MVCKMGCASALTAPNRFPSPLSLRAPARTRAPQQSPDCCYPGGLPCSSLAQRYYKQKKQGKKPCFFYWSGLRRLARCASARTGTHAGTATVPRTVATLAGCPVRVLRKDTTNKKSKAKSLAFFIGADYETRPVRFCAHRHARGHRNSPPDCCYPGGLPCSSLAQRYYKQKKQGKKPCFLYWSGLRDSNSLPPPWQGGALPDELNPQTIVLLYPAGAGLSSPFFAGGNKKCRPLVGITIGTTTYR